MESSTESNFRHIWKRFVIVDQIFWISGYFPNFMGMRGMIILLMKTTAHAPVYFNELIHHIFNIYYKYGVKQEFVLKLVQGLTLMIF